MTKMNSEQLKALSLFQTATIQALNADISLGTLNITLGEIFNSKFHPDRATPTEKPKYIQDLIDTGRIDSEMTVLTSLPDIAIYIRSSGINLKANHLRQFKNPKTNKEYSSSAIRQAITAAYTQ